MNAYAPSDMTIASIVAGVLTATLLLGFGITRIPSLVTARCAAWLLVCGGVVGIERLTAAQPPGFRMVALIAVLLFAMKSVVVMESCKPDKPDMRLLTWFCFAGLWVGMRPTLFADVPGPKTDGAAALIRQGIIRLITGCLFVACARIIWVTPRESLPDPTRIVLATAFLLPGISLIAHFGVFNIVAGIWRLLGARCRPLFRAPLLSRSLTEFWGQRWNMAFSEMTAIGVFRPLKGHIGPGAATAIAFLFSGLLHELAISVPAKAGFGLPLLYFAMHAAAMFIERRMERAGRPIHGKVWLGRFWTTAWLVIPLPILFHEPFLRGCVWPLIGGDLP